MRSGGGSFQHPLTEPLFSRRPSYLPPFLSLCFSSSAFKMAVHLSVQLANWALSVTGPFINSQRWKPFKRAAFQHLWLYYSQELTLCSPLRQLSEADRGQETKQVKNNLLFNAGLDIMHQQPLTSRSSLKLTKT